MDAEQRMAATKGAILSLLQDAYVRRDRVAVVIFKNRTAEVVLRPTSSVSLARRRLEKLSVGGTTPLTHGLMAGYKVVKTELLRDQTIRPLLVLISDGRGNISMFKEEPLVEAQKVAGLIEAEQIDCLVIDSARDYSHLPSVQHLARVLNAINPSIGGVLIRGEKGTGKSTAVRALARLLPDQMVVEGCHFGCHPEDPEDWCYECRDRAEKGPLPVTTRRMRVVELPINASEDRVVGTIDLEAALKEGSRRFEPGVLAEANRNILYVDEVNLLDDHIVDVLLDAAAMGVNTVEREGVSVSHPSRFI